MGKGSSSDQTIGYKYMVGMHMVSCHGPADYLTRLTVDERVAWTGLSAGGVINVNAPELFGGDDREGGVSGRIDVEMGLPTQTKNAYLLRKIGANIPAYRGVVALVFRQCYMGNNPYLKPWRSRLRRIHKRQDGLTQWYNPKAAIPNATNTFNEVPCGPGQTAEVTWWQNTFIQFGGNDEARCGLAFLDATGAEIAPPTFPAFTQPTVWTERTYSAVAPDGTAGVRVYQQRNKLAGLNNDGYIDDITLTVDGIPAILFVGDGESLDNWVSVEGSVVLRSASPAPHGGTSYFAGFGVLGSAYYSPPSPEGTDMNPSHIIRECLTNPDWGMGYSEDDVDDATFALAADKLFYEGLGISLLWDKQTTLESFISEIVRHIDGALYVSRSTGKFRLKLTRADYDVDTLLVLDESNIDKIESPTRPAFGELINSVTVNFWNASTGKDDSVTVQDPAGVQMQGTVINTAMQYPGFTSPRNGTRIASRDLRALSNPFLSCTVYTTEAQAENLDIGDCFKLTWSKWYLTEVVMRVTGFAMSDGRSSQIRITCVEDVFGTPVNAVVTPPAEVWVDPAGPPDPAAADVAFEIPYFEIVQKIGQTQADDELASVPERGFVGAAAMRGGTTSIAARLWTDAGTGYTQKGVMDLCPGGFLTADLTKTATTMTLVDFEDLDLIVLGTHAQIGDGDTVELVRVDSVDVDTGVVTMGRGVLDTVPHEHTAGTVVLFWDNYSGFDTTEYVDGEVIAAKVTPTSGQGQVALASATEHDVLLDQRAYRPYPPGNLTIDGESYAVAASYVDDLTIAWVGRDRLLETSGDLADHFDGNIGPEAGSTYRLRSYVDGVFDQTLEPAVSPQSFVPGGEGLVRIDADTKRDGVYSWQAASHEFYWSTTGARRTEEGDYRLTESGPLRVTED